MTRIRTDQEWEIIASGADASRLVLPRLMRELDEAQHASWGGSVEIIGPSQADQIETLLATYDRLLLMPGTYALAAPIDIPSSKSLIAPWGRATIAPDWAPDVGDADLSTNYVIGIRGVASATTTTLTGNHLEGSFALVVASTAEMSAGSFLYMTGNGGPSNDALLMSDGTDMMTREVVEVASVTNGTTLVLKRPLAKHHSGGRTVTLLTSSPGNVTIRGIDIRAPGGTIAVGISLQYAHDVTIDDCSFEGFSRAAIDGLGSRCIYGDNIHSFGEVNAIGLWDGCDYVSFSRVTSASNGLREHANGIPRALWTCDNGRNTHCSITNSELLHANLGVRWWGGHHLVAKDLLIQDMIPTAALARDPLLGSGFCAGFDVGAADIDHAAFALGCVIENVRVIDIHSPIFRYTANGQPVWAVNLHDMFSFRVVNLAIFNRGSVDTTKMHGLHFQDCIGLITSLHIEGCFDAISTLGDYDDVDVSNVYISGRPSTALPYLPVFALYLGTTTPGNTFRLSKAKIVNYETYWQLTAGATSSPDVSLEWRDFQMGTWIAEFVILARRIAATTPTAYPAGSIAELDPTGSTTTERAVIDATGGGAVVGMICGQEAYNNGHVLFAPFPQRVRGVAVDATTAMGAQLEPNGRALTTGATAPVLRSYSETSGAGIVMAGPR